MKLRISGNSIRLRLLRPDVAKLIDGGRVAETLYLGPGALASLTYALETEAGLKETRLRHEPAEIAIILPKEAAATWAAENDQVGIYAKLDIGAHGALDLMVEKDFACLDLSDAENQDTFPNPQMGAAC
jgi:hypothetical protein